MAQQVDVKYIRFYSEGSAARQLREQYADVLEELHEAKKARRITLRLDALAIAGIALAVVMVLSMALGMVRLHSLRAENETLQAYVEMQANENTLLKNAYEESYDIDKVAQLAEAMGMVPQKEITPGTITMEAGEPESLWTQIGNFLKSIFA